MITADMRDRRGDRAPRMLGFPVFRDMGGPPGILELPGADTLGRAGETGCTQERQDDFFYTPGERALEFRRRLHHIVCVADDVEPMVSDEARAEARRHRSLATA